MQLTLRQNALQWSYNRGKVVNKYRWQMTDWLKSNQEAVTASAAFNVWASSMTSHACLDYPIFATVSEQFSLVSWSWSSQVTPTTYVIYLADSAVGGGMEGWHTQHLLWTVQKCTINWHVPKLNTLVTKKGSSRTKSLPSDAFHWLKTCPTASATGTPFPKLPWALTVLPDHLVGFKGRVVWLVCWGLMAFWEQIYHAS